MIHLYKDYVVKEDIDCKCDLENNLRYLLEVPLVHNTDKSVLVIMKNPSKADRNESDLTINRVLKFCNSKQYSKVYIMNLYAYYSTDPAVIANLIEGDRELEAIGEENDSTLEEICDEVDEVIVAWGSNTFGCTSMYKERIRHVTQLIAGKDLYYVERKSKCGWYPKHAQFWSVNSGIEKYSWMPPFNL